jgi:hypothetical protein
MAGVIIPPSAATIGTIVVRTSLIPALISKPTRKKKIAIRRSINMPIIYTDESAKIPTN